MVVEYNILGFRVRIVGINIAVIIRIFSIIKGLDFLGSHFRGFE